ncbi:MAG: hypothetical protein LBS02_01085 [Hungatella sp.]|nr:hypothetical protein [Hungatella sp.]
MKRVQYACLNQTVHFHLKEDMSQDMAVRAVKAEYEDYKEKLDRSKTAYKIISEQTQNDGSIIVKIKRQINQYDVGNYLD